MRCFFWRALVLPLTVGAACVITGSPAGAATTPDSPTHYVALGDSYSSGQGAGDYLAARCARSANAYAADWASANQPAAFTFAACSGATVGTVVNSQIANVSADTTLVSITVGGNDIGFSTVMMTCAISSESACLSAVNTAETKARTVLPNSLDVLYSKISDRAPDAEVVVLDYPHLYGTTSASFVPSAKARAGINEAADVLDQTLADAAARHGFTFGDVRPAFAGHEVDTAGAWERGIDLSSLKDSYHPTATGQELGYLSVLTSAIDSAVDEG